jgi:hypothetical protein
MRMLLAALVLVSAGCGTMGSRYAPETRAPASHIVARETTEAEQPRPAPLERRSTPPGRKIIFNGSLLLQVPDSAAPEKEMRRIVKEAGGWVHKVEGTNFTLRVPADRFHSVMERLAGLGKLIDRRLSGTDVTEEYLDLEIRLRNAEKVLERLTALLEKAKDVKEAIAVEKELARVAGEIERMKGRLRYLSDQVAHSTIEVSFQRSMPSRIAAKSPDFPFPWIREMGFDRLTSFR